MNATDLFASVFIVAIWVIGLGVDVYFIAKGGEQASVSFRVAKWSMKYPIIPGFLCLTLGLLLGHLFWPNHAYCP